MTIIYYNSPISGTTWIGSGTTVPHNAYLHLYHDSVTGWTLNSLKHLFISGITGCISVNIPLDNITFNLYEQGSEIQLYEIVKYGQYFIYISISDSVGNITTSYIYNIVVNDSSPEIIFNCNIFNSGLTGNTIDFSGATGITSGINIYSGVTFNLFEFDKNIINKVDIIYNCICYVIDNIDYCINKYMINVLIIGSNLLNNNEYQEISIPGYYCIKLSLINSTNYEIVYYFLVDAVYDPNNYNSNIY